MAIMRLQFEESPTERVSSQPIPIGKPAPPCGGVEPCPASWRQLACNGLSEREVGRWGSSDQLMAEALGCFNGSPPADLWPQGNKVSGQGVIFLKLWFLAARVTS